MDYDNIPGRSGENARKAIALAEERGFDATEVLTYRDGYRVPVDLSKEKSADEAEKPAPKTARKRTAKKE